ATPTSPTATGETYTYGNNTFTIYKDANGKYATINSGTDYYKFEPIRWIVIAASTDADTKGKYGTGSNKTDYVPGTKQLLLLSEFGLYREYFDKENTTSQFGNDACDIQVSLNNGFADMAGLDDYFENGEGVSAENGFIAEVTPGTTYTDSSSRTYFDTISSYNIFLLGYGCEEELESDIDPYYWAKYMYEGSEQMQCVPTAFAQTTGVNYDSNYDACYWWLRTGSYNSIFDHLSASCCFAYKSSYVVNSGANVDIDNYAARPCFVLNLA
ncbi:MAG: hypothetical protein IJA22_03955, partial [Clostridia bacterium]|nr:hypothetical protein [Clostridia bacterium]